MLELSLGAKVVMSLFVVLLVGLIVVFHLILDGSPYRSRSRGRSSPR
jgi:hypothetical protein